MALVLAGCEFVPGTLAASGDGALDDGNPRPDGAIEELVVSVAANDDDALQDPPPGGVLVEYSWISMYTADHWGALRFVIPQVAHGAQIVAAFLDVYVDTGTQEDDPNVALTSEASANPSPLVAVNNNISSRPRGTASVTWMGSNLGSGVQRSPSIAVVVQERVDDPAWAAGQPIMFIFDTLGPSFEIRQHDHSAGIYSAQLTVRFVNP